MSNIRPCSDLRDSYDVIVDYCRQSNEPVYLTNNGRTDLVVLSVTAFERMAGELDLHRRLGNKHEAISEERARPYRDVFADIKKSRKKIL